MCGMFCPACGGRAIVTQGLITAREECRIDQFLACTVCPAVSEIMGDSHLIDLGSLVLDDIETPFIKPDRPPHLGQSPATVLHGRRDS